MKRNEINLYPVFRGRPDAVAILRGREGEKHPFGTVKFYETVRGVLVVADVCGLPVREGYCQDGIFAFHIHGGSACTGSAADPFADAGSHYNPHGCPHPYHAGDLPPLFATGSRAFLVFLTGRFCVREIIGKTVIIHDRPDDFTTQPSGNAGNKIACGVIARVHR